LDIVNTGASLGTDPLLCSIYVSILNRFNERKTTIGDGAIGPALRLVVVSLQFSYLRPFIWFKIFTCEGPRSSSALIPKSFNVLTT